MRPAAHHQAVLDILSLFEEQKRPLDHLIQDYFRSRRYAGSKDRRAVHELCFAVVRGRALSTAILATPVSPRQMVICHLARQAPGLLEDWTGANHTPNPLSASERALVQRAQDPCWAEQVYANVPREMRVFFDQQLGLDAEPVLLGMSQRAPMDLRVNTLLASRDQVLRLLHQDGIEATATPYSPIGVRLFRPTRLDDHPVFQKGWIEIQDEGSQLIALLADPQPGHQVLDYCAGAGGKALALGALQQGQGKIVACDISSARLRALPARLKRAGLQGVRCVQLPSTQLMAQRASMDIVLVDAPCSGTGTWRRAPDLPWRQSVEEIQRFPELQLEILQQASAYVRPGGALVYATCSVLPLENQAVVAAFLQANPHFALEPVAELGGLWPQVADSSGRFLSLWPHLHGCDGFFAARLRALQP
ncbi:MAG: RsmB/NOP family class I SAM-dependent RNA methyltransferase [Holosporales bacterium]